jgi:hypothetical protein
MLTEPFLSNWIHLIISVVLFFRTKLNLVLLIKSSYIQNFSRVLLFCKTILQYYFNNWNSICDFGFLDFNWLVAVVFKFLLVFMRNIFFSTKANPHWHSLHNSLIYHIFVFSKHISHWLTRHVVKNPLRVLVTDTWR